MNPNAYNTKHTVKKYSQFIVSDRRQDEHLSQQ